METKTTIAIFLCFLAISINSSIAQDTDVQKDSANQQMENVPPESQEQTEYGMDSAQRSNMGAAHPDMEMKSSSTSDLHSIMHKNMHGMMHMKMTGNIDQDFAAMMTRHHSGGIEMANNYLNSGKNQQLKKLAEKMISANQMDIEKLQTFLKENKAKSKDSASSEELIRPVGKMMDMQKNMEMNGNIDESFLNMMINHHRGAMDMADVEIEKGKNMGMKSLARKIKDQQKNELKKLEEIQGQMK